MYNEMMLFNIHPHREHNVRKSFSWINHHTAVILNSLVKMVCTCWVSDDDDYTYKQYDHVLTHAFLWFRQPGNVIPFNNSFEIDLKLCLAHYITCSHYYIFENVLNQQTISNFSLTYFNTLAFSYLDGMDITNSHIWLKLKFNSHSNIRYTSSTICYKMLQNVWNGKAVYDNGTKSFLFESSYVNLFFCWIFFV